MVLPLILTLSRREREPSGRRFRAQHIAGWRFAYPAYITIKFQKVNHHRRPAQAQRRRAKGIAPGQTKKSRRFPSGFSHLHHAMP